MRDGGLPAGTVFPDGLTLKDKVPQGHKVALVDLPQGSAVLRADQDAAHGQKLLGQYTRFYQGDALGTPLFRQAA